MTQPIYLDYSATTPLRPEVAEAMMPYFSEVFGNPSSIHCFGRDARIAIEEARDALRAALNAERDRLVFTGSGTEADNLALCGFAGRHKDGCIIYSAVEHKAVLECATALAETGYDVRAAPVRRDGSLDLGALVELIPDDRPSLVSTMWANNETGVVQPIEEVAALCSERGALLHSDAVQALGKVPINASLTSMIAVSAHKLGGPKGVGALWIADGVELEPLMYGGGHQYGLRSGTENVPGCVGFAHAATLAIEELSEERARLGALRDRLEQELAASLPGLVINSRSASRRLPNVLSVSVTGIDLESTLTALDLEGLCVSSGSACSTGAVKPSHVITAMGMEGELARNTLRLSLGWRTSEDEIDRVVEIFPRVVARVREFAAKI